MKARDWIQQTMYVIIGPAVRGLIRLGVTPNMVTGVGAAVSVAGAGMIVRAASLDATAGFRLMAWAAVVMFVGSLFDMLDGQVARLGGMSSRFGAMFDSVLDKYTEMLTLLAIVYYYFAVGQRGWALATCLTVVGAMMVSYVRARAEGLGLACHGGLMQRPERIVLICVGCLVTGLARNADILGWLMAFMALTTNLTALWRLDYCRRRL